MRMQQTLENKVDLPQLQDRRSTRAGQKVPSVSSKNKTHFHFHQELY